MATREENKRAKKNKELKAQLSYSLSMKGYTKKELAEEMDISPATLYNKLRNPDSFTLGEIRTLFNILQIENEKKLVII